MKQFYRILMLYILLFTGITSFISAESSSTAEILIIQPRNFLKDIVILIRKTNKNVFLVLNKCSFQEDEKSSVYKILRELVYLNSRGIKVEILLETGDKKNYKNENVKAYEYLTRNGITVYRDSHKIQTAMNFALFDNFVSIVASGGFTDENFNKNDSLNMWIESEEFANNLQTIFDTGKKIALVHNSSLKRDET